MGFSWNFAQPFWDLECYLGSYFILFSIWDLHKFMLTLQAFGGDRGEFKEKKEVIELNGQEGGDLKSQIQKITFFARHQPIEDGIDPLAGKFQKVDARIESRQRSMRDALEGKKEEILQFED